VALLLPADLSAADGPANKSGAIFTAARAAVDAGRVERSKPLGFNISKVPFTEMPADGALLVGFDVGVGKFLDIETVYALRPVYQTAFGETSGQEHGLFFGQRKVGRRTYKSKVLRRVRVLARPGYAVGGVTLRTGLNINGLSLTFMRVSGRALDPRQSYTSEWVGDRTGGGEAYISGDGAPVVGVFGSQDVEHVSSLGLIYMSLPPVVAQAPAPPSRTERPPERPAAAPPRVEVPLPAPPAAPPAPPKEERAQAPAAAPKDEPRADGPAAPNPARDEDRPWPAAKAPAHRERVAQPEPVAPASAEGVDWLPFAAFGALLVPAFALLFVSLTRKKPVPPPRRPRVDMSKAPPAAPAAAGPNPTAICDRPRPAGPGARSAPASTPAEVPPAGPSCAKPNARVYYHVTCGKATIVSGDDYILLECPFRPVSSTYCCGCQTFVPLHMVRWADSDESVAAYRQRVRAMVPFWRQVYLALFGNAYEGAVNWGKEWKGGPLPEKR
jgi:hypothetical protein